VLSLARHENVAFGACSSAALNGCERRTESPTSTVTDAVVVATMRAAKGVGISPSVGDVTESD
jgi:hypothetical protein